MYHVSQFWFSQDVAMVRRIQISRIHCKRTNQIKSNKDNLDNLYTISYLIKIYRYSTDQVNLDED